MAEVVDPRTGQRWSSVEEFRYRRGGGGAEFERLRQQQVQEEARKKAEEESRLKQVSRDIDLRRDAEITALRTENLRNLARAKDLNERISLIKQFRQDKARIMLSARTEKVSEGVTTQFVVGGMTITGATAEAYAKALEERPLTEIEVRELERAGVEFKEVAPTPTTEREEFELRTGKISQRDILFPKRETVTDLKRVEKKEFIDPVTKKVWHYVGGEWFEEKFVKPMEKKMLEKPVTWTSPYWRKMGLEGRDIELERKAFEKAFPPIKAFEYPARSIVWTTEKITGVPIPTKQREQLVASVSDVLKFGFFAPMFKTGTAQVSEYRLKYERAYEEAKLKAKEIESGLTYKKVGKTISPKTFGEKFSDFEKMVNKLRGASPSQRKEILKFLRGVYGKDYTKLMKDYVEVWGQPTAVGVVTTPPLVSIEGVVPELKGIQYAGSIWAGRGLYEKTEAVTPRMPSALVIKEGLFLRPTPTLTQLSKQQITQLSKQQLADLLTTSTLQKSQLTQLSRQELVQKTLQKQQLGLKQISLLKQEQILKLKQRGRYRFGEPTTILKPKLPKVPPPIIKFGAPTTLGLPIAKKVKEIQGYITELKQRGKWHKVSKKILSEKGARALGSFAVDRSLSARFRIKETKKAITSTFKDGFLKKKFRDYQIKKGKKIPMKDEFIELRKFRLDMPKEKQTIQQLRKSAAFKAKFIPKKKRKKKKKSTTNSFLLGGGFNFFK